MALHKHDTGNGQQHRETNQASINKAKTPDVDGPPADKAFSKDGGNVGMESTQFILTHNKRHA